MFELFVFGTWMLVVVELIVLFAFIDNESGIGASLSVLTFALGAVWGVVKWWIFCPC